MHIPDTPDALFEALAEPSLHEIYPFFNTLGARDQKLLRVLHTELTKGELTDATFHQVVNFILTLWRSFNYAALRSHQAFLDSEDEVDDEDIAIGQQLSRLDQYLFGLLTLLEASPKAGLEGAEEIAPSRYTIREPGEP